MIDTKNLRVLCNEINTLTSGPREKDGFAKYKALSRQFRKAVGRDEVLALLDALERKDLLIANLTDGEEHSHKCVSCGYRYTPPDANEECPFCAGDGTPLVQEPLTTQILQYKTMAINEKSKAVAALAKVVELESSCSKLYIECMGYATERDALAAKLEALEKQEPVVKFDWSTGKFVWLTRYEYSKHHLKPLYLAAGAAPVATKPLSEEEIEEIHTSVFRDMHGESSNAQIHAFARAIEAAIKEQKK